MRSGLTRVHRRSGRNAPRGAIPGDVLRTIARVRNGLPYVSLVRFERLTALPREALARWIGVPLRTLSRRQRQGRLQPDESDRLLRAWRLFDLAVALFEGDRAAARRWLQGPQPGLGGETPLEFATTEIGAREVERLIGRLEHGVLG